MRPWLAIAALLGSTGCDDVLGLDPRDAGTVDAPAVDALDAPIVALDRDNDGTPDDVDLCIAPMMEGVTTNIDNDGVNDFEDTCPYDGPNGADNEPDGIGAICDPFPTLKGRHRCLMLFSSSMLNTALWPGRPPDHPWAQQPLSLIADPPVLGNTVATTIVAESIEGESYTRYDLLFTVNPRGELGSITVWLRANPLQASPDDIGCRYSMEPGGAFIGVVRGSNFMASSTVQGLQAATQSGRLTATIVTTGPIGTPASVACAVGSGSVVGSQTASPPLGEGRFGLMVDRWRVAVTSLDVQDQP